LWRKPTIVDRQQKNVRGARGGWIVAPEHLFGPDMRANPYPVYHRLRAADPIHWDETSEVWIVTRYRDVATLCMILVFLRIA